MKKTETDQKRAGWVLVIMLVAIFACVVGNDLVMELLIFSSIVIGWLAFDWFFNL